MCCMASEVASTQVWMRHFKDKLRIRFSSHHAKCGQCLRRRLIMRKLGHCPGALRAQRAQLDKHLARQHRDRQVYWFERARSRLCATNLGSYVMTAIIDSMDQAKHAWPRSVAMQAKCFNSWSRPRLASTTMLCHGQLALMCLSPHYVTANGSRTCEVLSAGLSMLQKKQFDTRLCWLNLQGDNCSKELKNATVLQMVSLNIALGQLKGSDVSFLASGHSHEDIDAFFSIVRGWLERQPELWTPCSFQASLKEFLKDPAHRPYEPMREVVMMSQYRDWQLGLRSLFPYCV